MKIKQLISNTFEANCYLILHQNKAVIIDPCVSVDIIQKELESHQLVGIFLTHGHFDHILHLEELAQKYSVKIFLHQNAIEKLSDFRKNYSRLLSTKIELIFDEERLQTINHLDKIYIFDDMPFTVFYTPGHTNCSVCYLIDKYLFTGDTLFKENIGRSDLYSGDFATLQKSLKFLKTFRDDIVVYPGHGMQTTIGDEKKNNYYFQ